MAYLMIKKQFTLRQAYEFVKQKRPNIGPRSNFMIQLCRLELELSEKGILQLFNKNDTQMKYSLPMQVYELSSMRCVKYEEGIHYLLKRKRSKLDKYRNFIHHTI